MERARKAREPHPRLEVGDLDRHARGLLSVVLEREVAGAILDELAKKEGEHFLGIGGDAEVLPACGRKGSAPSRVSRDES